jgi:hypothetical protein
MIYSNPVIQQVVNGYNFNASSIFAVVDAFSLILTNICRNFVNDPNGVCLDVT